MRPTEEADEGAINTIAFLTGFFGDSAEIFFPDRQLFVDLWVKPYLKGFGCCNHVASEYGHVKGYILGACDTAAYQRYFLRESLDILRGLFSNRYPRWRLCLPYLWRLVRFGSRFAPSDLYPAHLHINLLPEVRGRGIGSALLARYLDCLGTFGVPGVQLTTTHENRAALKLYQRFGFRLFEEYQSSLWQPWLGRATRHAVLVRDLSVPTSQDISAGRPAPT
ncbi:MAG: GNAT family N-acetyltransferase [Trueperaceae bacterium]|nr:MAG: GNAT family N-acetyltransferase [Trueperaceae bacterium]